MKKTLTFVVIAVGLVLGIVAEVSAKKPKQRKATKTEAAWYVKTKGKGKVVDPNGNCGTNIQVGFARMVPIVRCSGSSCPPAKMEACRQWVSTCKRGDTTYTATSEAKDCVEIPDPIVQTEGPEL